MKHFLATAILSAALALPALAADYTIMAPAAPGGGWDQTARAMQEALTAEGISGNVQVVNVPGAGGTIGLAQFARKPRAIRSQLIVGGYVMVGAILTNKSPVTLDDVTPIARLTGEYEVDRRAGRLRHQDAGRSRRQAEGRSGRRLLGRRLGRRHRPHHGRPVRQDRRRRSQARSTTSPSRAAAKRWRPCSAAR